MIQHLWYEFSRWVVIMFAHLYLWPRYQGRRNIPKRGAVLVVANHQSHLDPPLISVGCPRQMNFLARKTLFDVPVLGGLIRNLRAIPIDRNGMGIGGFKEALRRLKRGEMVLVFPEGARCFDGEMQPFLAGFTALAVRSGAAVLPVGIEGAFHAWPRMRRFPRRRTVHVAYGAPITAQQVRQYEERALVAEVERRVRQCVAELRQHPDFRRILGKPSCAQPENRERATDEHG